MADDLDFNINMNNDLSGQNTRLNVAPQSNAGYSYNQPPNKGSGGYQPAQQLDASSQNNLEENISLFDIRRAAHPVAALFTFLFKAIGIVAYLFFDKFTKDNTFIFIVTVLSAAFDFWTVKNVTGRLLVGLRWWSEILPDGSEIWHFESHDQNVKIHGIDRRVFWWSQSVVCVFWALISFLNLLSLQFRWFTCSGICVTLSVINYWGYYKCSKDHQKKFNNMMTKAAFGGLTKGLGF